MISFFDVFKWDRFVAPSMAELLFWLLSLVFVLLGVCGIVAGLSLVNTQPATGLLAIALSLIGAVAGIVGSRVFCEFVVMTFRLNENLMEIRDAANAAAAERIPAQPARSALPAREAPAVASPVVPEVRVTDARPETRPQPGRAPEVRAAENRPIEPRSQETNALEVRLAEIRARRAAIHPPIPRLSVAPVIQPMNEPTVVESRALPRLVEAMPESRLDAIASRDVSVPIDAASRTELARVEVIAAQISQSQATASASASSKSSAPAPKRGGRKSEARKKSPALKRDATAAATPASAATASVPAAEGVDVEAASAKSAPIDAA